MKRIAVIAVAALAGWTACGNDTSSDTAAGAAINPPTGLTAVPLSGGAHLTWMDNSDNEAEFMIERKTGSADWSTIGTVPFNTTLYHDAGLTPGTTYVYRVMAMPQEGEGGEGAAGFVEVAEVSERHGGDGVAAGEWGVLGGFLADD